MRLRAGLILFFSIALVVAGGCRKPLAPTFDRNQAPETWITAAPLDTLTTKDDSGLATAPTPGVVPSRFHLYWAGSDPDGKVVGFYYAVTETLPVPIPPFPNPPSLPGPKASDYKYTSSTDGVFTFTVSQERVDRQHTFYIYAVDNQGKPDPTPARFMFNAIDRFPPVPVIDDFTALGYVCQLDPNPPGGVQQRYLDRILTPFKLSPSDTVPAADSTGVHLDPKATIPSGSRMDIRWHSEITAPSNPATSYRYRMDEPDYIDASPTVNTITYNSGVSDRVAPGLKIFRLRAIDSAGGKRETTRLFNMNFPPYAWFAGPDRSDARWTKGTLASGGSLRDRYFNVSNWTKSGIEATGIHNFTLMGPDSAALLPHQRVERKTFFELWSDPYASPQINRIYARAEGDTVHMNSWVVFFSGGFDKDSPYSVIYRSNDPKAPDSAGNPVVQPRPPVGSPVGFRARVPVSMTPDGQLSSPGQTGLYPIFDPASVFRSPTIAAYSGVTQAGLAYFVTRAEDGDGRQDTRVGSSVEMQPANIVKAVDSGTGSPAQIDARSTILKFYVDFPPTFTPNGTFPASLPATFAPRPNNTVAYQRTFTVSMPAFDPDPFVPGLKPAGPGGPSGGSFFRYTLSFTAPRDPSDTTAIAMSGVNGLVPWYDPLRNPVIYRPPNFQRVSNFPTSMTLPDSLGGTFVMVTCELCDCADCELTPGQGRCVTYKYFSKTVAPPTASLTSSSMSSSSASSPGPGDAVLEARRREGR